MNKKTIPKYILILIILFIGYKSYYLIKYNIPKEDYAKEEIFKDKITINNDNKNQYEMIKYGGLSCRNNFKDFVINDKYDYDVNISTTDTKPIMYWKKNKQGETTAAIVFDKWMQYYNILTDGRIESINTSKKDELHQDEYFGEKDKEKFLKDNNIKNDIDLLYYVKNNYYLNNNIFTSNHKIKEHNIINLFTTLYLIGTRKITLIDGDLQGFIVNLTDNFKEIHLFDNDEQYIITLSREELTNEVYLNDFLKTITINK